ncbi:MAG TPA: aminoacyl-tRNA hydrolase [Patescibacteria group bacterium]|nr:aminoacyl-tRNA hydrolase [Patescibacteria group bacterium]
MGLFQKKPDVSSSAPLYTLGLNKTLLLVGLGNIGNQYSGTRHNLGFACLDVFAKNQEFGPWQEKKDLKALVNAKNLADNRVMLIKPTTLMNNSGGALRAVASFYKIPLNQTVVIHDELDIKFGQIKSTWGGGSAGHNGIKSLIQHLGDDSFGRIRIGIGPKKPIEMDSADFVLAKFSKDEQNELPNLEKEVIALLTEYVFSSNLTTETRSFIV